ncbi:MAG: DUF305 domain-containing protein [Cyclonatronaceae bacterium]
MHKGKILYLVAAVIVSATVSTGCSSTVPVTDIRQPQQEMSDREALFWANRESSRMNYTGADVDFMTKMIAHHAQALMMSALAEENHAGTSVQVLAARIINAQQDEIETMQKWLRDRGRRAPQVHINGLDLSIRGSAHQHSGRQQDMDMPGMLSREQLEELAAAKGIDFDRAYLTFMIQHHEGAVIMVQELFNTDGAANDTEIFRLASEINAEQITEIERMRKMLEMMTD